MRNITIVIFCLLLLFNDSNAQKDASIQNLWRTAGTEIMLNENYQKAIPTLKKIASYAKEIDDDYSYGSARIYTAYCFLRLSDFDSTQYYGYLIKEEVNDLILVDTQFTAINADYRYLLGKSYFEKGLYEQASVYFQEAIELLLSYVGVDSSGNINYSKINGRLSMPASGLFNDAALTYDIFGDYDKSINYFDISMKLSGRDVHDNARRRSNLSLAYLNTGNLNEAIIMLKKAQKGLEGKNDEYAKETYGLVYKNMAHYYYLKEEVDSCIFYINKALDANTKDEFKILIYHVYLEVLSKKFSDVKIKEVFDSITVIADRSIGLLHPDMARSYKLKGNIFQNEKEYISADENYNFAINILQGKKSDKCNCKDIIV